MQNFPDDCHHRNDDTIVNEKSKELKEQIEKLSKNEQNKENHIALPNSCQGPILSLSKAKYSMG